MTQQRFHAMHHDSQRPTAGLEASAKGGSRDPLQPEPPRRQVRSSSLPDFVDPGPQAGDLSSLRFLEPRRLRRFDVDGPSPLLLTLNGRPVGIIRPGKNTFDPPVPLQPGDELRLEAIEPDEPAGTEALSGWSTPSHPHAQPGQDQ